MKMKEIFSARRELKKAAGKLEYYFFTTMLLSAFLLCAVLVIGFDAFFKSEPVKSAYTQLFSKSISSAAALNLGTLPEFTAAMLKAVNGALFTLFENAPSAVCFGAAAVFLLCPVYQGTVRYCAYLIEERRPLPLAAVLFYFTKPSLYFSSVWLTVRIAAKKLAVTVVFLLPPAAVFQVGSVFNSVYFGQRALGGALQLLALVLFVLSILLCAVFLNRFAAVRYLFALGGRKKLFRASVRLTKNRRTWLLGARLALLVNLLPAVLIIPAPMCLTRALSGEGLLIKTLLKENKKRTANGA